MSFSQEAEKKSAVLSVSAHDPLGMAGIAMDQRALASLGVHCASCITANTAQNQHNFYQLNPVPIDVFVSQLDALHAQDIFSVIKIGMIANPDQAMALVSHPIFLNKTIILDPVLAATSESDGEHQTNPHTETSNTRFLALSILLPYVDLLTPNLDEAHYLISQLGEHKTVSELVNERALAFHDMGVKHVLLKGGHSQHMARDYYSSKTQQFYLEHDEYSHGFNRGTGCAMAALIAGAIALNYDMADAVVIAKSQMQSAWQHPFNIDEETGSLTFSAWQHNKDAHLNAPLHHQLPKVYLNAVETDLRFLPCQATLGVYPIVDRAAWLARLLPLGIRVIQLRIKDLHGVELKQEIQKSIALAEQYNCQLFINDYWQLAIECGAYGVHLGQEDIDEADLSAIANGGLRLGLSSHCFYEVARAKTIKPSYIAFGPVYATQTKDMPWVPKGETGLSYWRAQLTDFPLVAIGGIHGERFEKVKAQGVNSIAMISAITQAENPEQVCRDFIERWNI